LKKKEYDLKRNEYHISRHKILGEELKKELNVNLVKEKALDLFANNHRHGARPEENT
jgi:hypothetical protein